MILGNRTFFVLLAVLSVELGGCGGGGGGGTPATPAPRPTKTPAATPTPTVAPTPTSIATASSNACSVTAASAATTGTTGGSTSRPLTSGDTFSYAGSSLDATLYCATTPNPSGTVAYAVTQTVTNAGPTPFASATPYDLVTTETDTGATTVTSTTNTFLSDLPYDGSETGLYTYGYTMTNSDGQTIADTLSGVPSANGLLDVAPEAAGQMWTNSGAGVLDESDADGFRASRSTTADGAYTETDTYPQPSNYSSPAPLTLTLDDHADGSGTYSLPEPNGNGGYTGTITLSYSAPANGSITIVASDGTTTNSAVVGLWYALPLYSETDTDEGAVAIPAACNVATQFGTTGNAIRQTFRKVDTVLGTDERFDQVTYVVGGYAVCTTLNDTTYIYYDYSGQGDTTFVLSGGNIPAEKDVLTSTLGLTASSESAADRRADAVASTAVRIVSARENFLSVVEQHRLARVDRATRHLRSIRLVRSHR